MQKRQGDAIKRNAQSIRIVYNKLAVADCLVQAEVQQELFKLNGGKMPKFNLCGLIKRMTANPKNCSWIPVEQLNKVKKFVDMVPHLMRCCQAQYTKWNGDPMDIVQVHLLGVRTGKVLLGTTPATVAQELLEDPLVSAVGTGRKMVEGLFVVRTSNGIRLKTMDFINKVSVSIHKDKEVILLAVPLYNR